MLAIDAQPVRRAIRIHGIVQGVGFRPSVYRRAIELGLAGFVKNELHSVLVEVEGSENSIDRFARGLGDIVPPAGRIERIEMDERSPRGDRAFRIAASTEASDGFGITIPPDLAPCAACLSELSDPKNRRSNYAFINCTHCGPRFTIVERGPYDRCRTTMAEFALCDRCHLEYNDPANRRFHAEPNACPACGPRVSLGDRFGQDAIATAIEMLARGAIVAIKGVGGFLLAADATDAFAVERLRKRKQRPHRPFAVMARDLEHACAAGVIDDEVQIELSSPARPIVIVPDRGRVAPNVAPGLKEIGLFLPPSPLQQLITLAGPPLLVMTSGNLSGEPIIKDDAEARERLSAIADAVLLHDRRIHARADDSVVRPIAKTTVLLRRARGFVPDPILLPASGPAILAVGGQMKSTICLAHGGRAILSQHIGDLSNPRAYACFQETIEHFVETAGTWPEAVAHDLHPDYRSTRWAVACGLPAVAVQHHHAHVAACLAEHDRTGPVLGVAFDGNGFGDDGTLWGGEILSADLASYRRIGHLSSLPLLGGARAIEEPWRLAAAALLEAGEPLDLITCRPPDEVERLQRLYPRSPRTTAAGRWFDAVAALLSLCTEASYDGQPAAELEACALAGDHPPYELAIGDDFLIDLRPAIRQIAAAARGGIDRSVVSARFHETMARAVWLAAQKAGQSTVALTGGCFANRRLTERAKTLLEEDGFEVLLHRRVPPNDGGLALGQAAIASHRLR